MSHGGTQLEIDGALLHFKNNAMFLKTSAQFTCTEKKTMKAYVNFGLSTDAAVLYSSTMKIWTANRQQQSFKYACLFK